MAKSPARPGSMLYRGVMFVVVSVVAGVLVAGLFVPFAGMAGAATRAVSNGMQSVPAEFETPPQSERSRVLMADGNVLATFWEENRVYVPLADIAPVMREAQVAIEDHRFYEHGALDARATLRALVSNTGGGNTQGASGLTQQYVKQVQIEAAKVSGDNAGIKKAQERSFTRKIQELRYAVALEKRLSKDEILERYLNIAYYGDSAYGVQSAAHHYFNTTAKELTLDQASLLAGVVQNPGSTDPVHNTRLALERRNVVLTRMAQLNIVTADEAARAKEVPWDPKKVQRFPNGCVGTRYPFLCDYVKRSLQKMPALGNTPEERLNTLNRGGLTIETEIDPATQDAAQDAINKTLNPNDPVISTMTMIQPGTGLILAMAQNRHVMGDDAAAGETYFNYAVGGGKSDNNMGGAEGYQPGSTNKPFAAAAALEQGFPLGKTYDAPQSMEFGGQKFRTCGGRETLHGDWKVTNSTDAHGIMDMYKATANSTNTYYVQLMRDVGGCDTTKMAKKTGVKLGSKGDLVEQFHDKPSFVLGSAEVTPLSMTEAYATFAARGKHCDPIVLKRITDKSGREIKVPDANCKQVMEPKVADGMNDLLSNVMTGTGRPATIPGIYSQAGKTGTTDDNQAVWFAGYTPEIAGVAMIAVDKTHPFWDSKEYGKKKPSLKNQTLPSSKYRMSGSGGGDAGQDIYRPSMTVALRKKPKTKFKEVDPEMKVGKPVAIPNVSGMSPEAAKVALQEAGFTVGRITKPHESPAGTYLGPSASGTAPMGSTINLVYSSGPQQPTPAPGQPGQPGQPPLPGQTPMPGQPGQPGQPPQPGQPSPSPTSNPSQSQQQDVQIPEQPQLPTRGPGRGQGRTLPDATATSQPQPTGN